MAVGLKPAADLLAVRGVRLAAASAGIYARQRADLVLIEFNENSKLSAVFTRNAFAAAPVLVARKHLKGPKGHRFCLINAGNANAGTGRKGYTDAVTTCSALASLAGCRPEAVLPFSTGVIGQDLPVDKITRALPKLLQGLDGNNWNTCAAAIMTTDTLAKGISRQIELDGQTVTVTGMAKGAGMIRPDMATMLAYIATDAVVDRRMLDRILKRAVTASFNRICIDGDMSTNDACVLIATGAAGHKCISNSRQANYRKLEQAVMEVCVHLATAIVRDGEGASKFVSVNVEQGRTQRECLDVAYAIATSPLVKTALFASDPNWGRILAAVGRAGIAGLDVARITIYLNGCCIVERGARAKAYTEEMGKRIMQTDELVLRVLLGRGKQHDSVWTCDLSHEYVRINAEYRS